MVAALPAAFNRTGRPEAGFAAPSPLGPWTTPGQLSPGEPVRFRRAAGGSFKGEEMRRDTLARKKEGSIPSGLAPCLLTPAAWKDTQWIA